MAQIALPGGIPQGPTLAEGFSKGLQQGIGTGMSILQFQQQRKQNQQALVMAREKLDATKIKRQFGQFKLATELLGSDIALNKKLGGEIAYGVIKNNKEMQALLGVDVGAFNLEEFLTTVTPEVSDTFNKNNAKDLKAVEKGEMSELSFVTNFTARLSELPVDDESKKPLQEQAMKTLEDLGAEERNILARERKGKDLTSELDIKRQGKLSDISAGVLTTPAQDIRHAGDKAEAIAKGKYAGESIEREKVQADMETELSKEAFEDKNKRKDYLRDKIVSYEEKIIRLQATRGVADSVFDFLEDNPAAMKKALDGDIDGAVSVVEEYLTALRTEEADLLIGKTSKDAQQKASAFLKSKGKVINAANLKYVMDKM